MPLPRCWCCREFRGSLFEERLQWSKLLWEEQVLMNPSLSGHSWAPYSSWRFLWENSIKKGQNHHTAVWGRNEKRKSVKNFCRDQGEGKKRGSAPSTRADILLQLVEQIPTLQPVENPTSEQVDIHWLNWSPRRSRGTVWGKGTAMDWHFPHHPPLLRAGM